MPISSAPPAADLNLVAEPEVLSRLVDFPSCRRRSGHGIASAEFDTEEFADGYDVTAATAFSTGTYLVAHQVAGATSPLTEKAFLAA